MDASLSAACAQLLLPLGISPGLEVVQTDAEITAQGLKNLAFRSSARPNKVVLPSSYHRPDYHPTAWTPNPSCTLPASLSPTVFGNRAVLSHLPVYSSFRPWHTARPSDASTCLSSDAKQGPNTAAKQLHRGKDGGLPDSKLPLT